MDVLSGVVQSMHADPGRFTRLRRESRWGGRFGPYPGAGLHVVLAGSCWLIRDGRDPVPLRVGDVVLLPHGSRLGLASRADVTYESLPAESTDDHGDGIGPVVPVGPDGVEFLCGSYLVEPTFVHPMLRALPDVIHVAAEPRRAELHAAIGLLTSEMSDGRLGSGATRAALLELVLVFVLRAWVGDESAQLRVGWAVALTDPLLAVSLNRLHEDPAHPWSVDELATLAGLSRTAFSRRFTRTLGQSPASYVTWWRLNSAARALLTTDTPLANIARDVGYGSLSAFANAFRREFGIYPGQFRTANGVVGDD